MVGCKEISKSSSNQSPKDSKVDPSEKDSDSFESSFYSVKSNSDLFPSANQPLVISFYMRFLRLPPIGKRQKLIANYDTVNKPLAGWSLALTRFRTGTRFEMYLMDVNGKGGWHTLSPLTVIDEIDPETWYAVTFIVDPEKFVSSIYSRLDSNFNPINSASPSMTGVSTNELSDISADSTFQITSGASKKTSFRTELKEISIFKLKGIPNDGELLKAAELGPRSLKNIFHDSCVLAIDGEGEEFCKLYAKKG